MLEMITRCKITFKSSFEHSHLLKLKEILLKQAKTVNKSLILPLHLAVFKRGFQVT